MLRQRCEHLIQSARKRAEFSHMIQEAYAGADVDRLSLDAWIIVEREAAGDVGLAGFTLDAGDSFHHVCLAPRREQERGTRGEEGVVKSDGCEKRNSTPANVCPCRGIRNTKPIRTDLP